MGIVVDLCRPAPATLVVDSTASGALRRLLELAALFVCIVNLLPQQSVASLRWLSWRACLHYLVLGIHEQNLAVQPRELGIDRPAPEV